MTTFTPTNPSISLHITIGFLILRAKSKKSGISMGHSLNFWDLISFLSDILMFCNAEKGHFFNFSTVFRISLYSAAQCLRCTCQVKAIEYHFQNSKIFY